MGLQEAEVLKLSFSQDIKTCIGDVLILILHTGLYTLKKCVYNLLQNA